MHVNPDLEWYASEGEKRSLPVRCPFAASARCPRYFQSVALLGESGITTRIPETEDARLIEFWSSSELWRTPAEQSTSVSGGEGAPHQFSNFCPEVSYDTFNFFGSYLSQFSDEIDRDSTHEALMRSGVVGAGDWRWSWQYVEPLHYSSCSLYSLLQVSSSGAKTKSEDHDVFQLRPTLWGISVDLKKLFLVIKDWWRR